MGLCRWGVKRNRRFQNFAAIDAFFQEVASPLALNGRGFLVHLSKRRLWLVAVAAGFAFAGISALLLYDWSQPTTLRIAVSPAKGDDTRLISAIAGQLGRDRAIIRLRVIERDTPVQAAQAVDSGDADLAVVRRDAAMPAEGQAIVLFRHNLAALVARPGSEITKVEDLAGHTIAIVGKSPFDRALLDTVLRQYEIQRESVKVVTLNAEDLPDEFRAGRIDAVLATGPLTEPLLLHAVSAASRDGQMPQFIEIGQSEAIAQRQPVYESSKITPGAFGGSPPKPSEEIETIGFTHYIVANRSLDDQAAGDLARLLLAVRGKVSAEFPAAGLIRAPDTDKDSAVPVHAGAAAYIDGDQKSFFDRYSDVFYIGVMVFSGIGLVLAAIAGLANSGERSRRLQPLARVLALMKEARAAASNRNSTVSKRRPMTSSPGRSARPRPMGSTKADSRPCRLPSTSCGGRSPTVGQP